MTRHAEIDSPSYDHTMGPPAETLVAALVFEYARLVDAGRFDQVDVLLRRATFSGPSGDARGSGAIEAMLDRTVVRYEDGTPRTRHLITNLDVTVRDSTATSAAYVTVLQVLPDVGIVPVVSGTYVDEFALDEGGWYFTRRQMTVGLVGDTSHHLRPR